MSQRAAEMLKDDLEAKGPVRLVRSRSRAEGNPARGPQAGRRGHDPLGGKGERDMSEPQRRSSRRRLALGPAGGRRRAAAARAARGRQRHAPRRGRTRRLGAWLQGRARRRRAQGRGGAQATASPKSTSRSRALDRRSSARWRKPLEELDARGREPSSRGSRSSIAQAAGAARAAASIPRRSSAIIRETVGPAAASRRATCKFTCIPTTRPSCASKLATPGGERAWTLVEDPADGARRLPRDHRHCAASTRASRPASPRVMARLLGDDRAERVDAARRGASPNERLTQRIPRRARARLAHEHGAPGGARERIAAAAGRRRR